MHIYTYFAMCISLLLTVGDNKSGDESSPESGFYVYDLGSTHGTYLNKQKVRPRAYCRLRIGQMLRFGGSTRLFILEVRTYVFWRMYNIHVNMLINAQRDQFDWI